LSYLQISLRESRETLYWLRICAALELGPPKTVSRLKDECDEIMRILVTIVINTKRRMLVGAGVFLFCILNFEF
jgi:four helix bundle protein